MEQHDVHSLNGRDQNSDTEPNSPTLETVSGFSTSSSPVPPEPFEPLFTVKFANSVEKDGEVVKYTIISEKVNEDQTYTVQRQYEDFEWLEHCLLAANPLPGLIVPPLPPKPAITSQMAEAKSKKQLGNNTKTLVGDQFNKDCLELEQYLRLLLAHCLFGQDEILEKFLTEKEPPPRAKVKKGFLSKLSESLDGRKISHKDCEEFFQKERDWVNKYSIHIKESNEAFHSVIYSQQRLCSVLGHLATALTLNQGSNDAVSKTCSKLCSLLSEAMENSRHSLEVLSHNDDITLGAYFSLFARYVDSEKEMLNQRTGLLVDYENANKALDKAKQPKKQLVEEAKLAAEKAFEDCSDVARQEIKKFHRLRIQMLRDSIGKLAEAQVTNAREVLAVLTKSLAKIKEFEISTE